ncbi:hypothetical protein RND71_025976 [Anisodus tanguticus]|uniref:S-protein homolog n=1 Tax=Anisodus tanguticus TaxID=243964 RepID=A0AAE1V3D2_9SOLA|nr:hypothetical protein RND71_025976 [Anisodus tanguticus]
MIRSFFILFIISYVINAYQVIADDPDPHIELHILDALPNNDIPLKFHCASKDDDLGWHYPKVGDDFHFSFRPHLFKKTLFFCHFWWARNEAIFDVYNYDVAVNCSSDPPIFYCIWKVQEDGFYMGPQLNQLKKMHDWISHKKRDV